MTRQAVHQCVGKLYATFVGTEASQIEINPLAVTETASGGARCQGRVRFERNVRHKDLAELRDLTEEDPMRSRRRKYDTAYIKWTATSAAGQWGRLAMATMGHHQSERRLPANFSTVGGGASKEKVTRRSRSS